MALFQQSVLKKHLNDLNKEQQQQAWSRFTTQFHDPVKQQNIRNAKEEQYQEGFLRELFVDVLGYTLNPSPGFNLTTEYKNEKDSKKADGAILSPSGGGEGGGSQAVTAVIELKGTDTTDLGKVETQAFSYKNNQKGCTYVITSNFEKLRFYINDAVDHVEFNLFTLTEKEFAVLFCCLQADALLSDTALKMKQASVTVEENVTKQLYADYSGFKRKLFHSIASLNTQYDQLTLFKKTQKLLDRFLFILFAEDRLLVPPNSVREILKDWEHLNEMDNYVPLYDRFKKYFGYLNNGYEGKKYEIFAYNGGLFAPDDILDNVKIEDALLYDATKQLSQYDFETEVDVNILGHIFEHSLTEIEEVERELTTAVIPTQEGSTEVSDAAETPTTRKTSKRKKDGVFYTPRYITKYIVENTVGALCNSKKEELEITDDAFTPQKRKDNTRKLQQKLESYRQWLLQLTICDPACGSGAFLNQALEFLIAEHRYIDTLTAKLFGDTMVLSDVENSILENNLFGVDINEEAVEIARLSLWLRTARKGRKLNNLNNNIKVGNSLIDDPAVAGDKAFNWQQEFPEIFAKGGFDVVIGNPPYGALFTKKEITYYRKNYEVVKGHSEAYYLFCEKAYDVLRSVEGVLGFIVPNAWLSNKYALGLREFVLNKFQIEYLINFNQKIIFEEADVETSILIMVKTNEILHKCKVGTELGNEFQYDYSSWKTNSNNIISFNNNSLINSIIIKLKSSKSIFADKLDISNGIKPYQAGYGINLEGNVLTKEDVERKIYHSKQKVDNYYKNELKGKGVHRYSLEWEESYIKWGPWLMSPKALKYHESNKILVRQIISDYFFATIDYDKYYADQSLYICINYENDNSNNLLFYLSLLNSRLYGFYFRKFYSEEDELFPKIKVNELKTLPVKDVDRETQNLFAVKAQEMLRSQKQLNDLSKQLVDFIVLKFQVNELSRKLLDWQSISPNDFLKELEKQKIKLSLPEQSEWMQYFEAEKAKANQLQQLIDATDKEIDKMVYALYELTEEEIKIVEG